jgi:hypothetical protein
MNLQQFEREEDVTCRVVDADGHIEHVVDLGAATDATVDVVDDTAIVVGEDDQFELALPESDAEAFILNGVLTITMEDPA